jgi:hypothetical protein
MIPRPEKLYFSLGTPIETARYRGRVGDPLVLKRVRDRVGRSLTRLIAELREYRAHDTEQGTLRRVLNRL